jgi:hypothetical protein
MNICSRHHTVNHDRHTYVLFAEVMPTTFLKGKRAWKMSKDVARKYVRETNRAVLMSYADERIRLYVLFDSESKALQKAVL